MRTGASYLGRGLLYFIQTVPQCLFDDEYRQTAKSSKGENMKKMNKKIVAAVLVVVLLVVGMVFAYSKFSEKAVEGSKSITIEVVNDKGESVTYELKTDALYLEQAMNEAAEKGLTYSGYEGPYGMTVDTVNGLYADYTATGSYWSFYVNGGYCNYGISEQPVEDGDAFKIEWTKA